MSNQVANQFVAEIFTLQHQTVAGTNYSRTQLRGHLINHLMKQLFSYVVYHLLRNFTEALHKQHHHSMLRLEAN